MSQAQAQAISNLPRRVNLPFLGALVVVIALYAVTYLVLTAFIKPEQMAGTVAALVLGGGPYIQRAIERREQPPRGPVTTRAGYQLPWLLLGVVATIAIWLAQSVVPYVQLSVGPATAVVSSIDGLLRLLAPATALVVGIVVAQRSNRWPLLVTLLAVLAGWLLEGISHELVINFATGTGGPPLLPPGTETPPDPTQEYLGGGLLGYLVTSQLPLLIGAAMVGHWYGTRTRLQAYLGGLLRDVAPGDRDAIVGITYDAAQARNASSGQRSSGSS